MFLGATDAAADRASVSVPAQKSSQVTPLCGASKLSSAQKQQIRRRAHADVDPNMCDRFQHSQASPPATAKTSGGDTRGTNKTTHIEAAEDNWDVQENWNGWKPFPSTWLFWKRSELFCHFFLFVLLTTGCYSIGYTHSIYKEEDWFTLKWIQLYLCVVLKEKWDCRVILAICLLGRLQGCLASAWPVPVLWVIPFVTLFWGVSASILQRWALKGQPWVILELRNAFCSSVAACARKAQYCPILWNWDVS